MPTQNPSHPSIPFTLSHTLCNIKLLELPDDLLEIISNTARPQDLYFKSSPAGFDSGSAKEGSLHLCGEQRSWLVKQVSTSNSVYVTRTDDGADGGGVNGGGSNGITAFAKPGSILELHAVAVASDEATVARQLDCLVPMVSEVGQVGESAYGVAELYGHIPAPRSTVARGLAERCVFEMPWSRPGREGSDPLAVGAAGVVHSGSGVKAYTPSAQLLLETWRRIVDAAAISGTRITGDLKTDVVLEAFADVDDVADVGNMYKAVAKAMFDRDGHFVSLGLVTRITSLDDQAGTLSEMETARWAGNLVLKVSELANGGLGIEKEEFEKKWEDYVPVAWVKYCSVEVLGNACTVENRAGQERISWKTFSVESTGNGQDQASQNGTRSTTKLAVTATSKGKRKWHEKFAAQRDVKR